MKQLIKTITEYTTTLEQQLAALEMRVAQLEEQLKEANESIKLVGDKAQSEKLDEPEVEVELIMGDEEPEYDEVTEETTNTEEEPEVKVEEEVKEEPKKPVPAPEKKTKTKSEAKLQPAAVATQGSLFGTMVEDIRQAISLGDRFLFQRELFDGNGELMQQALDELNELYTLNEALEYINEHFEWDKESTAAQLFENVLKRRFAN
jgi:Pyruvate/2-oxoacid:ferredoxin oxidoreductase gamma subunit